MNEKKLKIVEEVLRDFYNYHCVRKNKNPYYNDKRGDHTAAIRMGVFVKLKEKFSAIDSVSGMGVCNRLLKEEVVNLQSPRMYRSGHNHGLMVDIALLELMVDSPEYKKSINVDILIKRSSETLNSMWHKSGLTKEHSVSYQEYNIPLAMDYFNLLKRLGLKSSSSLEIKKILEESKRFLGYALKENGEYFPLGDSFRLPNKKILEKVYGVGGDNPISVHKLLEPYSVEDGSYSNSHFFIYRGTVNGKRIHFSATCCWDSHNHKQNDELSFCLEVDGVTIFDDPGYTEFLPWDDIVKLKSEYCHSTILISDKDWSDKLASNGKSRIENAFSDNNGFYLEMVAERVEGFEIRRVVKLKDGKLYISDSIDTQGLDFYSIKKMFVLSSEMIVECIGKEGFSVTFNDREVARVTLHASAGFDNVVGLEEIKYVMPDRTNIRNTSLVYQSVSINNGCNPVFLYSVVDLL